MFIKKSKKMEINNRHDNNDIRVSINNNIIYIHK